MTEERRRHKYQVYVANVGGFHMKRRAQGAAAGHSDGAFGLTPGPSVQNAIDLMRQQDGQRRKMFAIFVFTETQLSDVGDRAASSRTVRTLFEREGYLSKTTSKAHAGVMTAWDPKQVTAVPVGSGGRLTWVRERGRIMTMQFTPKGGRQEETLRVVGVYMPASCNPASVVRASWAKLLEVAENQILAKAVGPMCGKVHFLLNKYFKLGGYNTFYAYKTYLEAFVLILSSTI